MSSITAIPNPIGFKVSQNNEYKFTQYTGVTPPTNKAWINEMASRYDNVNISGKHFSQDSGVSHVPNWNGQTGVANSTPKAGLIGDGWFYNSTPTSWGTTVQFGTKEQSSLVANFQSQVVFGLGGNYQYCIMDAEAWGAGINGLDGAGVSNLQAIIAAWDATHPTKKLGCWALGLIPTQLRYRNMYDSGGNQNVTVIGNLATEYFSGTVPVNSYIDVGIDFGCQFCYITNSDAKQLYGMVMEHEMAKRRYPTTPNLWSVWFTTELIDSYVTQGVGYEGYKNIRPNLSVNGSIVEVAIKPQVPLGLAYSLYVFGYFLADGIHDWEWKKVSTDMNDAVLQAEIQGVYYELGDKVQSANGENALYTFPSSLLQTYDYGYLTRYKAGQCKSILEASTSWGLIEYSVDGGTTWRTGNDLAPSWGYWREEPIIRIKYNSANTEAVIIACNPCLNSPSKLTQSVMVRDVSKGLANTFTLVGDFPYIGKITL